MFPDQFSSYRPNQSSKLHTWVVYSLFALPVLLFIPVLYYSLTTPFALVDDYGMCYYVEFLDNSRRFSHWFQKQVADFSYGRYRPIFDLYNMVTWKAFGANPWLHHLARWILHFSAIVSFAAAYLRFRGDKNDEMYWLPETRDSYLHLIPLAILVYIWLFFPNSPASRLGPQEVYTVLFLGLCSLMLAYIIEMDGRTFRIPAATAIYATFYLAYLGLSWSKEINIAPMLWVLIFYFGLLLRGVSWRKIIGGVPLLIIFIYTVGKIYIASHNSYYGVTTVTPELVINNAAWLWGELFQVKTSIFITIGFTACLVYLIFWTLQRIIKREITGELLFVIFLIGQFVSLYLIICTSWAQLLRYWYILIPSFASLLAFSAKFMLLDAQKYSQKLAYLPMLLVGCLLVFFIGSNYYNFLLQTIAQHSLRQAEAELIKEVSDLHDQGNHIQILKIKNDPEAELVAHLIAYFHRFSPRFFNKKYRVFENKPEGGGKPYYLITMHEQPGEKDIYKTIDASSDYWLLSQAYRVAEILQGKRPYLSKDAGVHLLDNYRWIIYKMETGRSS